MVKVREDYIEDFDGEAAIDQWLDKISSITELGNIETVRQACETSLEIEQKSVQEDRVWAKEHNSFVIGLEMAQILIELELDQTAIIAAILYRAVREGKLPLEQVSKKFGGETAKLIEGVARMAAISATHRPFKGMVLGQTQGQIDNVRKMLVTMIDDVRVVLIKLAERTCAIRAVKDANSEKRQRVAREVFDIYAPLAHRLGIGYIKWELEDLSFRYLHTSAYKKIAKLLDERRVDRDSFVKRMTEKLELELENAHIRGEVAGRSKHIYSIWRKMRRKNLDFSEIYDIRAFRILVPSVQDCYSVLGVVHSLWKHIPYEFDDYIANPKENGYRSLHTAVIGPEGKVMEVQIRTREMHEEAELGVCAHWRYKGTDVKSRSSGYEEKINWLRQVLEWQEEVGDASEIANQLSSDVGEDRIYVFTPDGHVVDLPNGATPVDFAYRVHTEVGHACRGAKVNGRIVPLTYPLRTGEQIHILTSNQASPSRDWLNPSLGYIQTSRSRAKLVHWFKQQNRSQNITDGRILLEDELKRLSIGDIHYSELVEQTQFNKVDDLFAAIGAGDVKPTHIANVAQKILQPKEQQLDLRLGAPQQKAANSAGRDDIKIKGVGRLLTTMAKCCQPVPGDPITGYITVGRGVSIHRQDCMNLLQLEDLEPNRIIEVSWGYEADAAYGVGIEIQAYDREGLLRDITIVLANEKVNVTGVNSYSDPQENIATITIAMDVSSLASLGQALAKIKQLPNIIDARRKRN
ncbi:MULTISPECIES: GTP diphosphokinase [unclassified Oleiphilus]|jgi:GTP pyrophosphokinase|nr:MULTISPECIES: GTP diphosphokinase [unclassified Oleiphilus]KZY42695.1 (p)ppGpp synthetase [Oleiphilus sp. HI0050]KZY83348.1 (p)ppGpp synthetase [Oleiphilus sp. HI0069]KZY94261.1 (p)ppGpp synthetase [Oleiphilus sp. HI0072]KZZ11627.1 (p)ppGpp synthetase [Oleiphilus sp. HI0078]KZZ18657.1 (p)ppGpp synthetase [Oleiphilus sp. HI0081]